MYAFMKLSQNSYMQVSVFSSTVLSLFVTSTGNDRPIPPDHDRKLQPRPPGQCHPFHIYRHKHQHYHLCHLHGGHCYQPGWEHPVPVDPALPYLTQDGLHHIHDSSDPHRLGPWHCSALSDSLSASRLQLDAWARNVQVYIYF